MNRHLVFLLCGPLLVTGCSKEKPPRSVEEFLENPLLLEAAMVRCSEDRSKTRYDADCVNARLAVSRIQAREEAARQATFDAISERKRDALRSAQAAAMEARRRAAETERLRKEAEYLAQFGIAPPADGEGAAEADGTTAEAGGDATPSANDAKDGSPGDGADGGASTKPVPDTSPEATDLDAVREELRRRNQDSGD